MGANAATKTHRIVQNLYSILAIELITATQALNFRRPLKTSPFLEDVVHNFRQHVPFIEDDRLLHADIKKTEEFLRDLTL
jgi:histidine ammonia-lyase